MKFIIHYKGNYEDTIVIEGETIEDVKEAAMTEISWRGWDEMDCWSEEITEQEGVE